MGRQSDGRQSSIPPSDGSIRASELRSSNPDPSPRSPTTGTDAQGDPWARRLVANRRGAASLSRPNWRRHKWPPSAVLFEHIPTGHRDTSDSVAGYRQLLLSEMLERPTRRQTIAVAGFPGGGSNRIRRQDPKNIKFSVRVRAWSRRRPPGRRLTARRCGCRCVYSPDRVNMRDSPAYRLDILVHCVHDPHAVPLTREAPPMPDQTLAPLLPGEDAPLAWRAGRGWAGARSPRMRLWVWLAAWRAARSLSNVRARGRRSLRKYPPSSRTGFRAFTGCRRVCSLLRGRGPSLRGEP